MDDIKTIEDLELSELAKQEMEILENSIPDSYTIEVLDEVVRRFREKLIN